MQPPGPEPLLQRELARSLADSKPKRTVMFVLFGSEELGGYGNKYFLAHPPVPLASIVALASFTE